jgi:hypothetical protein
MMTALMEETTASTVTTTPWDFSFVELGLGGREITRLDQGPQGLRQLLDNVCSTYADPRPLARDIRPTIIENRAVVAGVLNPPLIEASYNADIVTITTTGGDDTSPTATNQITVPPHANCVVVWVGDRPFDEPYFLLHYEIDGVGQTPIVTNRNRRISIAAAAGSVVSFNTQQRTVSSIEPANVAASLKVAPGVKPAALTAPAGVVGLASVDKAGLGAWSPNVNQRQIELPAENSLFSLLPAARVELFLVEWDNEGNALPIRHVTCPAARLTVIECTFRRVSLATYDGVALSITAPTGTLVGGVSTTYRNPYTVTGQTRLVTASNNGFGGDSGTLSQNVVACLKNAGLTDGDDIVVDCSGGPVTVTMTAGGDIFNGTNYATAITKKLRIRSSTGVAADLTFTGPGWQATLSAGKQWILEGLTWDIDGTTLGCIFTGNVQATNFEVKGVLASGSSPALQLVTDATRGAMTLRWCWGTVRGSVEDTFDIAQGNGQAAGTLVVYAVGITLNANGSSGSHQVLTPHFASHLIACGCTWTDAGNTSNQINISPDNVSWVWLLFCRVAAAAITNTTGAAINCQGIYCCDLEAVQTVQQGTAASSFPGYLIGSRIVQKSAAGIQLVTASLSTQAAFIAGNDLTSLASTSCHTLDIRTNAEVIGNIVRCQGTSSVTALRLDAGSPPANTYVLSRNNRYITTSGQLLALGTSANLTLSLINDIFEGASATYVVGSSGTNTNIAQNCYFQRTTYPTNWATRFTATGSISGGVDAASNGWSASAPGLDADGTPTAGGNCDTEGKSPLFHGAIDAFGRSLLLGGTYQRGPVAIQNLGAGTSLIPSVWG